MDMQKYAGSESKYLKASDLQGRRPTVTVESVSLLEFDDEETGKKTFKPALKLKGKDKQLVMSPTNTEEMIRAFGADSEGWIGKSLELSTKYYKKFGKEGLIVIPIKTTDDPLDDIPFALLLPTILGASYAVSEVLTISVGMI